MAGHTRSIFPINLANKIVLSTAATSTVSDAATDFGPYFNVGRREVKFLVEMTNSPISSATGVITLTLLQGSTAATANSTIAYTTIPGGDRSSGTFTISSGTSSTAFEWNGLVSSRYVQARVVGTTSDVVTSYSVIVWALPVSR